jgi:hypothetical protein|tara:strand:- start:305827 stop:306063 length:237 start_codon:yes stop_codon:yes gene_type:complete
MKKVKSMRRLVIQTQDVQALMAVSAGYARRILREIKKAVGKDKKKPVTIREFSEYMSLDYQEVLDEINGTYQKTSKAT